MAEIAVELSGEIFKRIEGEKETKVISSNNGYDIFYIAYSDVKARGIHAGICRNGSQLKTGQLVLEVFKDKEEWKNRLIELEYEKLDEVLADIEGDIYGEKGGD